MMQSRGKGRFMESDVALYGMFVSVALVLSYVEAIIPFNFSVPGIKIGLANILIVWVLYAMGIKQAVIVSAFRVLIAGLLFGNLYSILFSAVGAALSLVVMFFLKKIKFFSIVGVSIAGGVMHNIGQIIVAMLVLQNARLIYYLPFLIISGVVAGIAVGILGAILYKKIKIVQIDEMRKDKK